MKLKLYILDYTINENNEEEEYDRYIDMWIDESKINGFYVPTNQTEIKCLNLFFNSMTISVVQNEELVDFLNKKFNVL